MRPPAGKISHRVAQNVSILETTDLSIDLTSKKCGGGVYGVTVGCVCIMGDFLKCPEFQEDNFCSLEVTNDS